MIKFTQVHIVLYFAKTWLFSRIWAKCPLQHNWNSHFTRYCFQLLNVLAVLSFDAVFFSILLWEWDQPRHCEHKCIFSRIMFFFYISFLNSCLCLYMCPCQCPCLHVCLCLYLSVWDPYATCACLSLTHVLFPLQ